MFDIGWSELLVIGVVAIIVVGPKDLPRLMRTFGHYAGKLRRAAADFQRQFEEAVRDTEIDEVRKAMQDFHQQAPSVDLRSPIDTPLMVPKESAPPAPALAAVEAAALAAAAKPKPKPRAKRAATAKPAAAKPATAKAAPKKPRKPAAPKEPKP